VGARDHRLCLQGLAGTELCFQLGILSGMPRYFFHIHYDKDQPDLEGEELPDMQAAWKEATVMAGQTIQSIDGNLKPWA
jgi:hypothetical protein